MDIESLRVFTEVARRGSFSGAARSLKIPTTSVSYKISKLEQSLKIQLFNRTTRSVKLTEIGHEVLSKTTELLDAASDISNLADSKVEEAQGLLRVSAPQAFGSQLLGDWLIDFHAIYPQVRIDMVSSNRFLDMQKHQLDFAFRLGPLPDSSLVARKLFDTQFCTFASPQFLEKHPTIVHPNDLQQLPCIASALEGRAINWCFQNEGKTIQWQPDGIITFEDIELMRKAALKGLGVAYLPFAMLDNELKTGSLVPVLQEWWAGPLTMYLVYIKEKHVAAKTRYFIEYITKRCEALYQ